MTILEFFRSLYSPWPSDSKMSRLKPRPTTLVLEITFAFNLDECEQLEFHSGKKMGERPDGFPPIVLNPLKRNACCFS
jgi:hypothetical protein